MNCAIIRSKPYLGNEHTPETSMLPDCFTRGSFAFLSADSLSQDGIMGTMFSANI